MSASLSLSSYRSSGVENRPEDREERKRERDEKKRLERKMEREKERREEKKEKEEKELQSTSGVEKGEKDCSVCIEKYNLSTRVRVICVCGYQCCRSCVKTYMLGEHKDASCMSCKVTWDRTFLSDNLDKTFMDKKYKAHREGVLFEREIGMLQATQPFVEKQIAIDNIEDEMEETCKLINELKKKLSEDRVRVSKLKDNKDPVIEKNKFVRKCPNNNCHGFLSSALKCALCQCRACGDCREIKEDDEHKCNKDIVETVKMLEKDSKGCPTCSALIFKINGCDQMYCVECHTAFSWNTLKIEQGVIHNPHYYEYQRRVNNGVIPRNAGDNPCGQQEHVLNTRFINRLFDRFEMGDYYVNRPVVKHADDAEEDDEVIEICRNVVHVNEVERRKFVVGDRLNDNLKLRIEYMRNNIDETEFKKVLQKNEKDRQKKTEIHMLIGTYVDCMTELLYKLMDSRPVPSYKSIKKEMEVLREYINECFINISKVYKCKIYVINKHFVLV